MDRQIAYQGQIPLETDLLLTNKNVMVAFGYLMQAMLGTSLTVDGLACVPSSPADLTVKVGPGSIHSLQNVDGTAYGTVPSDTTSQIVKQGLSLTTQSFSCPAPVTTGHSIVYLIQAAYQDQDAGGTVLPYYNASNPSVAWSGPNNTGVSQNTVRKGVCLLGVKAGISATTGAQATPAPDAGYVGLYAVTVANGQTAINSGHIQRLVTAPFIGTKLPEVLTAIQQGKASFAVDTSGAANQINVALSPVPAALTDGMRVFVKVANTVTGATVMNVNGLGNVAVVTSSGSGLPSGAMVANGIYTLVYDANGTRWQLQGFTAAADPVPAGALMPFAGSAAPSGYLLCAGQAVSRTTYSTLFAAIGSTYGAGDGSTTFNLPDLRGRVAAGKDDMNGSAANRITNAVSGITGTTLGASGGDERQQQHTHTATVTDPGHTHSYQQVAAGGSGQTSGGASSYNTSANTGSATTGITVSNANTGAGNSQNVQPTIILNYIIKT
jgi:microcystin-dependent protein